jgi:ABC-type glycerol-3-phosphate transport system substrate-binding protein
MTKTKRRSSITRRSFVKAGAAAITAAGSGIAGTVTARKAFAYLPGTSITFLLWKNFSPPADVEIVRQGTEWGKQNNVSVKIEQINANDIPARAAAAIESKQGPDIIQFFHRISTPTRWLTSRTSAPSWKRSMEASSNTLGLMRP